jgi:hypothetical protein
LSTRLTGRNRHARLHREPARLLDVLRVVQAAQQCAPAENHRRAQQRPEQQGKRQQKRWPRKHGLPDFDGRIHDPDASYAAGRRDLEVDDRGVDGVMDEVEPFDVLGEPGEFLLGGGDLAQACGE